jgi:geranylgeranyl reductase family protein
MRRSDVLVVGGGPGGSTCARLLRAAGWHVVVIEAARFPRDKVCAGWVTPSAFQLLDLDPADYRAAGLTIEDLTGFRTGLLTGRLIDSGYERPVSYAIRRCEFDHFLLRRSGASVVEGSRVDSLRRTATTWIVNGAFEAPLLIGAGGHFCPVARRLAGARDGAPVVVAREAEFAWPAVARALDGRAELYFCDDFEGYGWCVPKGDLVNVGFGRRGTAGFSGQFARFVAEMRGRCRLPEERVAWRGHAYLASGAGVRPLVGDGVLLVGDAAGLAEPSSGEGIRSAIASGCLAAETLIAARGGCRGDDLRPYAAAVTHRWPSVSAPHARIAALRAAVGRLLTRTRLGSRYVIVERGFLHGHPGASWRSIPSTP